MIPLQSGHLYIDDNVYQSVFWTVARDFMEQREIKVIFFFRFFIFFSCFSLLFFFFFFFFLFFSFLFFSFLFFSSLSVFFPHLSSFPQTFARTQVATDDFIWKQAKKYGYTTLNTEGECFSVQTRICGFTNEHRLTRQLYWPGFFFLFLFFSFLFFSFLFFSFLFFSFLFFSFLFFFLFFSFLFFSFLFVSPLPIHFSFPSRTPEQSSRVPHRRRY